MHKNTFIPFHRPSLGREEIEAVRAVIESGWLTTGPRTAQFEQEFAAYVGAQHALGVNSGTAALHLALAALGIGRGDEVITTPLTFCATVNCILQVGATPVLADVGPDGNIDPEAIRNVISGRTRALLPVHYGGQPCDMDAIWKIARERDLFVVEDAAHAVGASYRGHPIGSGDPALEYSSDAVAFSFYATKNLTTGEGGMLTSERELLIEKARVLCLHGITKDAWNRYSERGNWYYEVVESGFKYNLSDLQSAMGLAQLRKQEQFRALRSRHAHFYNARFAAIEELELPQEAPDRTHAWHLYPLRLRLDRLSITRAQFIEELRKRGVGASVHFIPIPMHPFFGKYARRQTDKCPRALGLYSQLVSLPLYPAMTQEQLDTVAAAVTDVVRENMSARTLAATGAAFGNE